MLIPFIPLNLKPEKTVLFGPISRSEREKKKLLSRQKINLKLINIFVPERSEIKLPFHRIFSIGSDSNKLILINSFKIPGRKNHWRASWKVA